MVTIVWEAIPGKKISFDLDIVQRGEGGLTQIQIVRGTI